MNRREMILNRIAEEANELAVRVSKALNFGLDEVQPSQEQTNAERIEEEFRDLLGVYEMNVVEGSLPPLSSRSIAKSSAAKAIKVEKFLNLSRQRGTLTEG